MDNVEELFVADQTSASFLTNGIQYLHDGSSIIRDGLSTIGIDE